MTDAQSPTSISSAAPATAKSAPAFDPTALLAIELSLPETSVKAVVALFAEGATVPFIARYRKEATGGLDEVQIRLIGERRTYLIEMDTRRKSILAEIDKQGKLSDALKKKIETSETKAELEDLYLPFKPKRRTRAMIATERGLLPIADWVWSQPTEGSLDIASFIKDEIADEKAAWSGARDIIAERLAEQAELRKFVRDLYMRDGVLSVVKTKAHEEEKTKFDNYAEFEEGIAEIASHRYLAIRRGEAEGILRGSLKVDEELLIREVERSSPLQAGSVAHAQMQQACRETATRLLIPSAQVDVRVELKMRADKQAVEVFARNLRELLMSAPLGAHAVLGIDPGQRTGCKCVVVDDTGKLLANETIYLVQGESALQRSEATLVALSKKMRLTAIAVGNGTHGRETEAFVKKLLSAGKLNHGEHTPFCVSVSESGASIYSASEVAREEFPDLDLTVRGAISIARRLQDPLAELVKIDPKSIGVGQYQHDIYQSFLGKKLDEVVESCVHEVGVELNTASAQLLSRVSGLGKSLATRIIEHRNQQGLFKSRKDLLAVAGLGPRAFEQAAGFLRIAQAENPLDKSAVHPERYALIEKIAADLGVPVSSLVGNQEVLARVDKARYLAGDVGQFTLDDIFGELLKPGRDPRKSFEAPAFRDDVNSMDDLKVGMTLEGVVTNVTAFGAFVDIGVHQDGLVHVSKLCDRFIKDPSDAAKVGDRVQVRVMEVDQERKRISLSARSDDLKAKMHEGAVASSPSTSGGSEQRNRGRGQQGRSNQGQRRPKAQGEQPRNQGGGDKLTHNPFADLFRR